MSVTAAQGAREGTTAGSRRRRHWGRWIAGGVVVIVVVAIAAVAADVGLSAQPPLALPTRAAGAPSGPIAGTWNVTAGSQAGFRVGQTVLGFSGDVTVRTTGVTGSMVVSNGRVENATFEVALASIKAAPQFAISLDTARYPVATVMLTAPVGIGAGFPGGATITTTAPARLSMHGTTRAVTVTFSARRDGSTIEVAGSLPVVFGDWGIVGPAGYGPLGSLADRGSAEFLLVLQRG